MGGGQVAVEGVGRGEGFARGGEWRGEMESRYFGEARAMSLCGGVEDEAPYHSG